MGLKQKIDTNENTGVSAEYWKIAAISSNWITGQATITMFGYLNLEARLANRNPVMMKTVSIKDRFSEFLSPMQMQQPEMDIIRCAYEYIKINEVEFLQSEYQ